MTTTGGLSSSRGGVTGVALPPSLLGVVGFPPDGGGVVFSATVGFEELPPGP